MVYSVFYVLAVVLMHICITLCINMLYLGTFDITCVKCLAILCGLAVGFFISALQLKGSKRKSNWVLVTVTFTVAFVFGQVPAFLLDKSLITEIIQQYGVSTSVLLFSLPNIITQLSSATVPKIVCYAQDILYLLTLFVSSIAFRKKGL